VDKRLRDFHAMMEQARASGSTKYIGVEYNPWLHDEDWPELVKAEQELHEAKAKQAREAAKQDKQERKAADKAAKRIGKADR
jgi:methylmalonyl-CoA mutase N-terminal domain/subunit